MRQVEQAVDEATEYLPVVQTPVTAVRPVVAQYDPAVHAVQLEEPVEEIKVPARQLEHAVAEAIE